jgi:hypothetical protein
MGDPQKLSIQKTFPVESGRSPEDKEVTTVYYAPLASSREDDILDFFLNYLDILTVHRVVGCPVPTCVVLQWQMFKLLSWWFLRTLFLLPPLFLPQLSFLLPQLLLLLLLLRTIFTSSRYKDSRAGRVASS